MMSIHKLDIDAIDTIDAAIFNGDAFVDDNNRSDMLKILYRWKKQLDSLSDGSESVSPWEPDPKYKEENERVVCAAVRDNYGVIIQGPRHLDNSMHAQIKLMLRDPIDFSDPDNQGFVNQWGQFLTRKEALIIAKKRGQIVRRCGGDTLGLYSENLY